MFTRIQRLLHQQGGIGIAVAARDSKLVGQEFMNGLQLSFDEVKKRVEPEQRSQYFSQQSVSRVAVPDVKQFVSENLLSLDAVKGQLLVPEYGAEKTRKGYLVRWYCKNEAR